MPLRPELEPLPPLMGHLPIDGRGYPVPAFVERINGVPEFRVTNPEHWKACVTRRICWVCGRPLSIGHLARFGVTFAFLIGPMCVVNRTTSEPPCHDVCAEWSARNCPFMARPHMVRREDDFTASIESNTADEMIKRNPGVGCVWYCDRYTIVPDASGTRFLIEIGDATRRPTWWCEGRPATRAEVQTSIATGLPALEAAIAREGTTERQDRARQQLDRQAARARIWLPRASDPPGEADADHRRP